jgi:hypothetical protein
MHEIKIIKEPCIDKSLQKQYIGGVCAITIIPLDTFSKEVFPLFGIIRVI